MRLTLRLASLALIVMLASVVAFAGGFQLNEHGARAMAQGGAWAARAYDLSAMYFNPAGLTNVQNLEVLVGTTLIMPSMSFFGPTYLNTNAETKLVDQTFTPINVYVGYKVMDRLAVGIGVNNPFGLGTQWPASWDGRYINVKTDLQTFFFTPTVAYQLTDDISIGAGLNYVTGTVKLKKAVNIPLGTVPQEPTIAMDMKGTGVGFNAGVLWKVSKEMNIGASYRSSVKIDASGSATFTPNYAVLGLPQGDVSASLELPATGFFGVSYKVMKNLEIEGDYQYIGWSSYKELAFKFKADGSTVTSPKDYKDTYILRFGGEYTWEKFQFRAGYLYDHSPVETKFVEPLLPDANRNGLNLGVGYKLTNALTIDVSYLYLKFDQRKAENTEVAFDGTYNATASLLGINLGYSF